MNNSDKNRSEKVKSYLYKNIEFSPGESEEFQMKIQQGAHKSRKINPIYYTVLASAASIFLFLSISFLKGTNVGPENERAVVGSGNEGEVLPVELSDIAHMNIGSEMPRLLYADDYITVIQGTFGVIVYNMQDSTVSNRISYEHMKSYDISMIVAAVSQDGKTIYIGNDDMSFADEIPFTYQYYIESRVIEGITEQPSDVFIPNSMEQLGHNEQYEKDLDLEYLMSDQMVELEDSFIFLRSIDWNMKNLQIVSFPYDDGKSIVIDVFQ